MMVDDRRVAEIGRGYLLLVGVGKGDSPEEIDPLADRIVHLRLFADDEGKTNRSLLDVKGEVLVVSQFTLYGDAAKGRRPSFIDAARPETAIPLYERFVSALRDRSLEVATGEFGADMQVAVQNDGPVTLILDRAP